MVQRQVGSLDGAVLEDVDRRLIEVKPMPGSPLETMVRVWTYRGPRYFVVKVREQL